MKIFKQASLSIIFGLLLSPISYALEIVIVAGENPTKIHPIQITLTQDQFWDPLASDNWNLINGDEVVPVQAIRRDIIDGLTLGGSKQNTQTISHHVWEIYFIVKGLAPFEKRIYQFEKAENNELISLERDDKKVTVTTSGNAFTEYRYAVTDKQPRAILYPLYGPNGVEMTRGYPMDEAKESEKKDHPHHQSLWVSHGDVNGVNFWHLGEKQGYQRHQEFVSLESGSVVGRIEAVLNWEDESGSHLLKERRAMTFWQLDEDTRIVDVDSTFIADTGDVVFGDTKEGGLLSLRVAGTLKEESGLGGIISNSNGETTEKTAWGKAAPWCDYSGPVGGKIAGLTIMDHPENPFYPSRYHVRRYGLFTANPFGLSYFLNNKSINGSQTLQHGLTWRCRYRVYIHPGDVESGNVAGQYNAYANAPRAFLQ